MKTDSDWNPELDDATITFAVYDKLTSTSATCKSLPVEKFLKQFTKFVETDAKAGVKLWSPVTFKEDKPKARKNANIATVTTAVFDSDSGKRYDDIKGAFDGIAHAAHTTHSHSTGKPKLRVVVPFLTPVPAELWADVWKALVDHFGLGDAADKSCKDSSRAFYIPSHKPGGEHRAVVVPGRLFDWTTLDLGAVKSKAKAAAKPVVTDEQPKKTKVDAIVSVLAPHWIDGKRNELACALGGWLARRGIEAAEIELTVNAICTAAGDEEEHDRISAAQRAAERVANGESAKGLPTIGEICGEEVLERLEVIFPSHHDSVQVDPNNLAITADRVLTKLAELDGKQSIFVHGGKLCRITVDENNQPAITPYDKATARYDFASTVNLWQQSITDEGDIVRKPVKFTLELAETMLAARKFSMFPALDYIVNSPFVDVAGALQLHTGYNEPSRLFYYETKGKKDVASLVPTSPSGEDCKAALDLLFDHVLHGFPFKDDASKANALGATVEMFLLPFINDIAPMKLVEAPTRSTGKSKLALTICRMFATNTSFTTMPKNEDDWVRKIVGILMKGKPCAILDNIKQHVDNDAFESLLTARTFSGKTMWSQTETEFPVRTSIWCTVNNGSLSDDVLTRTLKITIDADCKHPEQRGNFRCDDPPVFVQQRRSKCLKAILTLIQAWLVAGAPLRGKTHSRMKRYESVIGGFCDFHGFNDFYSNYQSTLDEGVSVDSTADKELVDLWWDTFGTIELKVKDLRQIVFREGFSGQYISEILTYTGPNPDRALGRTLAKMKNKIVGDFKIQCRVLDGYPMFSLAVASNNPLGVDWQNG